MQTLEIFKVAIEEWVLVVPLDFERDKFSVRECSDMIDFMGDGFLLDAVDDFLDLKNLLSSTLSRSKHAACAECLSPRHLLSQ